MDRFFWDPKELGQWMHKVVGLFIPPIDMQREDFVKDASPEFVNTHLDLIEASRKGDFGFLMWTSWPAQTAKFQVENIDAVLLRKMTIKEYLEKSQEIFSKELREGLIAPVPEPAR
jgi:raffinose/stachyose/melibiose transport system substrate-binding protein